MYIRLENSREFQLKSEHKLRETENILAAKLPSHDAETCCKQSRVLCCQVVVHFAHLSTCCLDEMTSFFLFGVHVAPVFQLDARERIRVAKRPPQSTFSESD